MVDGLARSRAGRPVDADRPALPHARRSGRQPVTGAFVGPGVGIGAGGVPAPREPGGAVVGLPLGGAVVGFVVGRDVAVGLAVGREVGLPDGLPLGLPVDVGLALPPGAAQVATATLIVAASLPAPALSLTCIAMIVTEPLPFLILTPCATLPRLPSGPAAVPETLLLGTPLVQVAFALDAETSLSKALNEVTVAVALPPPALTVAPPMVIVPSEEPPPPLPLRVEPSVEVTDGFAPIGAAPLAEMP